MNAHIGTVLRTVLFIVILVVVFGALFGSAAYVLGPSMTAKLIALLLLTIAWIGNVPRYVERESERD